MNDTTTNIDASVAEALVQAPDTVAFQFGGVDYSFTITKFDTYQTLKAMGALFKIMKAAKNGAGDLDLLELFAEIPDAMIEVIAVAIRKEPAFVLVLPPDVTFLLAEAALDANTSFFVERVLPAVTRVLNKVTALMPKALEAAN